MTTGGTDQPPEGLPPASDDRPPQGSGPVGWPPPPEPAPPEKRRLPRLVLGLTAAMIILIAVIGAAVLNGEGDADADGAGVQVGDCVGLIPAGAQAGPAPGAARAEKLDCGDSEAAYEVAVRLADSQPQCPSPIYTAAVHGGGAGGAGAPVRLCLTYNVREGDCYVEAPAAGERYDCALGPRLGAIRILRVVDGVADVGRCADLDEPELQAVTVPEPATTFCYVAFGGDGSSGPGIFT